MQRHDQSKREFSGGGSGRPVRFCGGDLDRGVTDRLGEAGETKAGETIVTAARNGRGRVPLAPWRRRSGRVSGASAWLAGAAAPAALRRRAVLPVTLHGPRPGGRFPNPAKVRGGGTRRSRPREAAMSRGNDRTPRRTGEGCGRPRRHARPVGKDPCRKAPLFSGDAGRRIARPPARCNPRHPRTTLPNPLRRTTLRSPITVPVRLPMVPRSLQPVVATALVEVALANPVAEGPVRALELASELPDRLSRAG